MRPDATRGRGRRHMPDERTPEDRIPDALPMRGRGMARWHWVVLIWIVPLTALATGGWLALRGLLNQGPTVVIDFKTAAGLEPGKTRVKYKDVDVGTVRTISLSDDRSTVRVEAELAPQARSLLGEETRFWVVRPRITGGQAFGLATILSGAYIAMDPGRERGSRRQFTGLETPPVVTADEPGREFVLRADDLGSVDIGSPVYFRRVRVGQIVSAELNEDGRGVTFRAFVSAPYDRYVTEATRFWNASGVDFTADSSGFHLETESLASVAIGGVAFQVPPEAEPGGTAKPGAGFELFKDRESAFKQPATVRDTYVLHFKQSVRGLNVGSPVDFRGVPIGEVRRVLLEFDRARGELRPAVEIDVYPERISARLRNPEPPAEAAVRARTLQRFVDRGLRAQLRTGNYITGQLYVTLDFFPKAAPARVEATRLPLEIPTVAGGLEDLQNSVAALLQKLEAVPLDRLSGDLHDTLTGLQATLGTLNRMSASVEKDLSPALKATLDEARETLARAQGALSEDAPLQGDVRGTLREVTRAAQAMRSLADYLERHPESLLRGKAEEGTR